MTAILEQQPGWVIDEEPAPLPLDQSPTPEERVDVIQQPVVSKPEALSPLNDPRIVADKEGVGLNPLNDPRLADVRIDYNTPLSDPRLNPDEGGRRHPAEIIDELREFDFKGLKDPEGENRYGRNDEAFDSILRKWAGQSSAGGTKGLINTISKELGGPAWVYMPHSEQFHDMIWRFREQPEYVRESPEGQAYDAYLKERLTEAIQREDTGFFDAMGMFIDFAIDQPAEVPSLLVDAIIDDPVGMAIGIGIYNKTKNVGLAAANAARIKKVYNYLGKQGKKGQIAKGVLENTAKIAPVVIGEAIYAGEYQRMNNVLRGAPIDQNVDNMRSFGALLGGATRGVGTIMEMHKAPYLGAAIRPEKGAGKISPEMDELSKAIGGTTKKGSRRSTPDSLSRSTSAAERTAHTGMENRQLNLPGFKSTSQAKHQVQRQRAKDTRATIKGQAAKDVTLKGLPRISTKGGLGGDEGIKNLFDQPFGTLFKLRDIARGWKIKTAMTNLAKGSGLINYDKEKSLITFDLGRFSADPVKSFTDAYIKPAVDNGWGREYMAAAKAIGFDLKRLESLLDSKEKMARFALAKEKFFVASHTRIPPRADARKAYRTARDMYRHEVSLYDALKEVGFNMTGLVRPGKFRTAKPYIAEKVASVLNTYLAKPAARGFKDYIKPALEKGKAAYDKRLDERVAMPPRAPRASDQSETMIVDSMGRVKSPVDKHPTAVDKSVARSAGVKAMKDELARRFRGNFDDSPEQYDLDLTPPIWRRTGKDVAPKESSLKGSPRLTSRSVPWQSMKGRHFGTIARAMQLLNSNKWGGLSMMLGRTPAIAILHDTRGTKHIDRWLGDNAIMDREAMKLQHRIVQQIPNATRRKAVAHYMENNLKDYNDTRVRRGLKPIELTEAEIRFVDEQLRPIMDSIFVWANKHNIIPRDIETGGVRYRRNFFPHIGKRSYVRSFEEYLDELVEKGKGGIAMKADPAYQRTFATLLDAQQAGYPMHTDVAKVMSTYVRGIFRVHTNRKMISDLKDVNVGDVKLIMPRDSAPADYVVIKHPVLMDVANEYMVVHPGIAKEMRMFFDTTDPSVLRRLLVNVNTTMKRIKVSFSLFHAAALLFSGIYSGVINPLRPIKAVKEYKSALQRLREGPMGDRIDFYLQEGGLVIGGVDDVNSEALIHLMEATTASINRLVPPGHFGRLLTVAPEVVKWLTETIDSITWDRVMSAGKILAMDKAYAKLVRTDIRNHIKTGQPLRSETELAREAASYVNDAFGGLNWARLARNVSEKVARKHAEAVSGKGTASKTGALRSQAGSYLASKHGRETMQLAAFAPDWSTANWRIALKGMPGLNSSRAMGDLYRSYMMRAILIHIIMAEGLQQINTGTSIFDNYGPRGWLRPHIGDGIYLELSKQLTETYRAGTYFTEGDLRPIQHKSSSILHVLNDLANGKEMPTAIRDAFIPISASAWKREYEKGAGHWGAMGVLGIPARLYDKPWERPTPLDKELRKKAQKIRDSE